MTNTTTPNNTYTSNAGLSSSSPFVDVFETRDPTGNDTQYPIQKKWLNTATSNFWELVRFTSSGGILQAVWVNLTAGSSGQVQTITGNSGGPLTPIGGNINVVGDGTSITAVGNPGTATDTLSVLLPAQYDVLASNGTGIAGIVPSAATGNPLVSQGPAAQAVFSATPVVNSITIENAPVAETDGVNKEYADAIGSGFTFKTVCVAATTVSLTAVYDNGAAGVGATLTNSGTQAAFAVDGQTLSVSSRVLIKNQTTTFQNGIYTVTDAGSGATNWVLTRATDFNSAVTMPEGSLVPVQNGTINNGTYWVSVSPVTTVGVDAIIWDPFGAVEIVVTQGTVYSNGAGALVGVDGGAAGQVLTSNGTGMEPSFQGSGVPSYTGTTLFSPAPGISFGGASVGVVYSQQVGYYMKIGQLVWFAISISLTSKGSSTGVAAVTGLPFVMFNFAGATPLHPVSQVRGITTGITYTTIIASPAPLSPILSIYECSGPTGPLITQLTDTNFTNTATFYITGTYPAVT